MVAANGGGAKAAAVEPNGGGKWWRQMVAVQWRRQWNRTAAAQTAQTTVAHGSKLGRLTAGGEQRFERAQVNNER